MGHQKIKMGFYYNQPEGFYYNQPKEGFYYNKQPEGFYYNQQPGFYYENIKPQGFYYEEQKPQGFYYDGFYYDQEDPRKRRQKRKQQQEDNAVNFSAAWKESDAAKQVMEAAKKAATAKVSAVMIANNHKPGATENRILAQISAERIAYEAAEIFMNSTAPDDKISTKQIQNKLFVICKKAIDES